MSRGDLSAVIIPSDIWVKKGRREALDELYALSVARAQAAAKWYKQAKIWKRRLGRGSRVAALGAAGIAGFIPFFATPVLLPGIPGGVSISPILSAVFVGLGAGFIALDKLFGWTSGWTRFALAANAIDHSIDDFQLRWQTDVARWTGKEPSDEQTVKALEGLRLFVQSVNEFVTAETEAWVAEFQSSSHAIEMRAHRLEVK